MKLEYVLNEVKELYPEMTLEELDNLIEEALQQKTVQEIIVNYICYVKKNQTRWKYYLVGIWKE